MGNIDTRDQIILGINFGYRNITIVKHSLENMGDFEYVTHEDMPLQSKISVNRSSGEVNIADQVVQNDNSLIFSSIYEFVRSEVVWDIAGYKWSRVDLLTAVLEELKDYILSKELNTKIIRTVISANLDCDEYESLFIGAGKTASLKVSQLINPPLAVIYNHIEHLEDGNYLFADITTENITLSALKLDNNIISTERVSYKESGETSIDRALIEYMLELLRQNTEQNIEFGTLTEKELEVFRRNAHELKRALAKRPSAEVNIKNIRNVVGFKKVVLIEEYNKILHNSYKNFIISIEEFLNELDKDNFKVDYIFLSGSGLTVPSLVEEIKRRFSYEIIHYTNISQWQAALGASKLAKQSGKRVLNKDIYLILAKDEEIKLINRGEAIEKIDNLFYLGLIEDASYAQAIVKIDDEDMIIQTPVYGFLDETIVLEIYREKNTDLKITFGSNKVPNTRHIKYKIENITTAYKYNVGDENEV